MIHGHARRKRHSPTYKAWAGMHVRCRRHPHYVRGGVRVCARWSSFQAFLADMEERPRGATLDRKENALGYFPSNCRWATWSQQARNQTQRTPVTAFGETLLLSEWSERTGLSVGRIWARIYIDRWPAEAAVTTPPHRASTTCKKGHPKPHAGQCPECKRVYNHARYHGRLAQAQDRGLLLPDEGTSEDLEQEL